MISDPNVPKVVVGKKHPAQDDGPTSTELQEQLDLLMLDSLDQTAALQQQIDDLILALLG